MATIKDVAETAGVTVTTVSRVLNNRGYISEKTRTKVHEAMQVLNYQPNEIARSLYRKQSQLIGLIIPTVAHPFFGELADYIELYAYRLGYKILLCNSYLDRQKEQDYIDMLRRHKVDGIIMGSHTLEVEAYVNLKMPLVTFDRKIADNIPYVASDSLSGGKLATNLLIDKGCQKIAHICGNLNLKLLANQRYEGFVSEAQRREIEYVIVQSDIDVFNNNQYEKIIAKLFDEHPDVDGVFTSDLTAIHVLQACLQAGKKIPEQVRVIGYDDIKLAAMMVPRLTTIHQPIEAIGKMTVELIMRQIHDQTVSMENILPVKLIERHST